MSKDDEKFHKGKIELLMNIIQKIEKYKQKYSEDELLD